MKVYHVTPTKNLNSIHSEGISPLYSKGNIIAVWTVVKSKVTWAVGHVVIKERSTSITILELDVPRNWLTRRQRGVWTCDRVIQPEYIKNTVSIPDNFEG